jgi:hypothetical protein
VPLLSALVFQWKAVSMFPLGLVRPTPLGAV